MNLKVDEYIQKFQIHGMKDVPYLKYHWSRFLETQSRIGPPSEDTENFLDIGAHFLHQTLLYALDGWNVTAADLPVPMSDERVQSIAAEHNIKLWPYETIADGNAFDGLPNDQFDVVLFSEVIEHITFNPVPMWESIFAVTKPGGRIIVTTPNAYHLPKTVRSIVRFLSGKGVGISAYEIVHHHTNGPHWKEYSGKEMRQYFRELSPDFDVTVNYFTPSRASSFRRQMADNIANVLPFLRKNLFVEIVVKSKDNGIVAKPRWITA